MHISTYTCKRLPLHIVLHFWQQDQLIKLTLIDAINKHLTDLLLWWDLCLYLFLQPLQFTHTCANTITISRIKGWLQWQKYSKEIDQRNISAQMSELISSDDNWLPINRRSNEKKKNWWIIDSGIWMNWNYLNRSRKEKPIWQRNIAVVLLTEL